MAPRTIQQGSSAHRGLLAGAAVLALAVVVLLPFVTLPGEKWLGNPTGQIINLQRLCAFAVAILGLNLLIGYTGQISIGHSAFVGLGAYGTVLMTNHGWSYFVALPLSAVLCFAVGCFIGLPALRIRGLYLVVVTFALAIVFPTLIEKYESFTGGSNGLKGKSVLEPKAPLDKIFDPRDRIDPLRYRYFIVLIVAAIMFLIARNLIRSRAGRGLVALRDNPTAAVINGVSVPVYKVLAFGVSAAYCGVAGWMLMARDAAPFASQGSFAVDLSITLIIGLVMGGVATIGGAIPGAIIVVIVRYALEQLTNQKSILGINMERLAKRQGKGGVVGIAFGVLLVGFVFVLPGGVIDGLRRLRARFVRITPYPSWLRALRSSAPASESLPSGAPDPVAGPVA